MKISKLEFVTCLLTIVFIGFAAGWFMRGNTAAQPIRVTAERTLAAAENTPAALPAPKETQKELININTAPVDVLDTLPGIGQKRAEDIVAYREANGPFRIPEDLTKVSGIGENTLEGLLDFITTGEVK